MEEYALVSKKEVKNNKVLKSIQKASIKRYRQVKGHFPKARIGKVVKLREINNFFDFTKDDNTEQGVFNPDTDTILNEIKRQNIIGLSGSGFSTAKKLQAVIDTKVSNKYLIINAVECDPGLLHDKWLLKNHMKEIEKGIELIAECTAFRQIIVASKEEIATNNTNYKVYTVADRYPMGAEKILINEVLDIHLADSEIPADKGILVLNVQTVYVIYEALYRKRPADSRFITVADLSTGEAVIARVKLNSSAVDIVSKVTKSAKKQTIYYGAGIMSARLFQIDDKITLKTNFIGYGKEVTPYSDLNCKKCGACTKKCPMAINVNKIVQGLEKNDFTLIKNLHAERCIKCGTCNYYCKAGKNTMELVNLYIESVIAPELSFYGISEEKMR